MPTSTNWKYFQPNFTMGHPDDQDYLAICEECGALVLEGGWQKRHEEYHEKK